MNEFNVDDRPRLPKRTLADDAECPERADVVESLRKRGFWLEAFGEASFTEDCVGDGNGDIWSPSAPSGVVGSIEVLSLLAPFEIGEVRPLCEFAAPGGGSLTGRGKRFARLFIRRGI
jgi:hypothetical protein